MLVIRTYGASTGAHNLCDTVWDILPSWIGLYVALSPAGEICIFVASPHPSAAACMMNAGGIPFAGTKDQPPVDIRCVFAMLLAASCLSGVRRLPDLADFQGLLIVDANAHRITRSTGIAQESGNQEYDTEGDLEHINYTTGGPSEVEALGVGLQGGLNDKQLMRCAEKMAMWKRLNLARKVRDSQGTSHTLQINLACQSSRLLTS